MRARTSPPKVIFRASLAVVSLAAALCLAVLAPSAAGAAPRVAVSLKPLHSLVAGVMEGVGSPDLILRGASSPHTYSLKPSEARLLENAEVIFWVGGALETFLETPLEALGSKARIVALLQAPGVVTLPVREGGAWDEHQAHDDAAHGAEATSPDGHLWLDPANAKAIARAAAEVLGQVDEANRRRYADNALRLAVRIDALDAELAAKLALVR